MEEYVWHRKGNRASKGICNTIKRIDVQNGFVLTLNEERWT